jgi:choloylglycine hydrolase
MAAATVHLAERPKDSAGALIVAEHLINRVDIPKGLVRDYSDGGKPAGDYTQWTTFRDHANKVFYWKSYEDPGLKAVDLKTIDFSNGQPLRTLSIAAAKPTVETLTPAQFTTATQ